MLYWQYDAVVTARCCTDSTVLYWQHDAVLTARCCTDSTMLYWQYDAVVTARCCTDSTMLYWQYDAVVTARCCTDSTVLYWQHGAVVTATNILHNCILQRICYHKYLFTTSCDHRITHTHRHTAQQLTCSCRIFTVHIYTYSMNWTPCTKCITVAT